MSLSSKNIYLNFPYKEFAPPHFFKFEKYIFKFPI